MPPSNSGMNFVPPPSPTQEDDSEAEKQWVLDQFYGGISDSEKQIVRTTYLLEKQYQFYFAQNGDILNDAGWFQCNRSTVLDSPAGLLSSIPRWIRSGQPYTSNIYIYCANGDMFSRDQNGLYTKLFTAQDSQGNGLGMWQGFLYYTTNSSVGIYGPLGSPNPIHNDSYLVQGFNNTSQTGIAPINTDLPFITIGHGNNIGKFDGTNWTPNQLTVPIGSYVRSLDLANQMLAIATASGPGTLQTNLGYVLFWDGSNYTYNNYVTADGGVDVILNNKNRLLTIIGSTNVLYTDVSPFKGQQRFPKLRTHDTIQVHPGSATVYKGIALFGIANSTSSAALQQGVYHWGNRNDNYPEGMNMDFTISTGNTTNISLGALYGTGQQLFIGWQDNNTGTFGIDMVSNSNPYYTSAYVEGVIIDDMRPVDDKNALTIKCSHLPLNQGETVQLAFKVNRGVYVLSTVNNTVGSVLTKFPVIGDYAQFKELQAKVIIGSAAGVSTPTVTTIGAAYMPQLTQSQY
jgi:hypothetical protein